MRHRAIWIEKNRNFGSGDHLGRAAKIDREPLDALPDPRTRKADPQTEPAFNLVSRGWPTLSNKKPQMAARSLARFIILLRSKASAFLLSLSSSGGIALNTPSIAMSFASAKLMFIRCNSCSILSRFRFDKSFSKSVGGRKYKGSSEESRDAVDVLPLRR